MNNKNFDEELLPMEELDQIAGGTVQEISLDIEFLRDIGFNIKWKSTSYIHENFSEVARELRATWNQVGVQCKEISDSDYKKNVYGDRNGNPILRKDAMERAMKFTGVTVDLAKYGIK